VLNPTPARASLPWHLRFDPSFGSHGLAQADHHIQEFPDVPNALKKQIFAVFLQQS
jgi:hypothetical protein